MKTTPLIRFYKEGRNLCYEITLNGKVIERHSVKRKLAIQALLSPPAK